MIWYILLILFTLLLLWLMLGPIILSVNTDQKRVQLLLPGVLKASIDTSEELIYIRGWVFFIPFKINPFMDKAVRKGTKSKMKLGNIGLLKDAARAFRIRKLYMDIDTDDFLLNAWLVPAFSAVNNGRNIQMRINFEGNILLDLDLRTRIGSLVRIFIKNRQSFY